MSESNNLYINVGFLIQFNAEATPAPREWPTSVTLILERPASLQIFGDY